MALPKTSVPVPQSDDEASSLITRLGELQTEIELAALEREDGITEVAQLLEQTKLSISRLTNKQKEAVRDLEGQLVLISQALQAYLESNKERLTQKGKTHEFSDGNAAAWRDGNIETGVTSDDDAITELEAAGLGRFVERQPVLLRQALNSEALRDPELVAVVNELSSIWLFRKVVLSVTPKRGAKTKIGEKQVGI